MNAPHDRPRAMMPHRLTLIATTGSLLACSVEDTGAPEGGGSLALAVTDTASTIRRTLAPGLHLSVERDLSRGGVAGWAVAVRADADTTGENLLYESREWHGPHPSRQFAVTWELTGGAISHELPVRGYPWVVWLQCAGCTTAGMGDSRYFAAGTLHVAWRPATARGEPPRSR
jgi:hypothetical protein